MKQITGCLIVLALNAICWADFGSMPSRQHKHKKHTAAPAVPASSMDPLPAAAGDDGQNSSPPTPLRRWRPPKTQWRSAPVGGPSVVIGAVQRALSPIIPVPVRSALDEAVMETNALAPLINDVRANDVLPNDVRSNAVSPSLHGLVGQWMTSATPAPAPELSGGIAMFRVGGQTDVAPAVSLRLTPTPLPKGEGGGSTGEAKWGWEVGGILPHGVSGGFVTADQTQGSTQGPITYNARLSSFYEIHAAAIHNLLPAGRQVLMPWAVPEIGLGLSFLYAVNEVQNTQIYTYSYPVNGQTVTYSYPWTKFGTDRHWSVSPLVRLGVVLFPQSLFSLRMDVAYVAYANTANAMGQTFDLGASGLMIQELVQVRL